MISIIIVNYYQKKFIQRLLESIKEVFSGMEYEVIISNNSHEEEFSPDINLKVIKADNRGFGAANNLAAKSARGEYLFILNPDTILLKGDYNKAISMLDEGAGALGFQLLNEDKTFQISFGEDISFSGEIKNKKDEKLLRSHNTEILKELDNKYSEIKKVNWVSGAAIFIKKEVFEKVGGFDEGYFLYYEDADFCKRIRNLGYNIYYYPYIKVIHLKGENTKEDFHSSTYFYAKQSQMRYYRKHKNFLSRGFIRIYLICKFFVLYITKRNPVDKKILKMLLYFSSSSSSESSSS